MTAFNKKTALQGSALRSTAAIKITETTFGLGGVCVLNFLLHVDICESKHVFFAGVTATEGCWS